MKFFKVTSLENTIEIVKDNLNGKIISSCIVPLRDSLGLMLAEDIVSPEVSPLYNRSTVDGYAVRVQDVGASTQSIPSFLKVVGNVRMGEKPDFTLQSGEAAYVATGAMIPEGASGVVMVEHIDVLKDSIAVYTPIGNNENIILKGEEIQVGQTVAKKGDIIDPIKISIFAGLGIAQVPVYNKIKIAIISTGDELVDPSEKAENGKIRDINTDMLISFAKTYGFEIAYNTRIKDNLEILKQEIEKAVDLADVVLLSGGSSIGVRDFTNEALETLGEILLHGVAIKPGKPTCLAKVKNKLVYGLPGNPFAALLVFKELCCDVIYNMRGYTLKPKTYAFVKTNFHSTPGRTTLQPVSIKVEDNKIYAEPLFLKSSHLATMLKADGYIKINANNEGVYSDTLLPVYDFYPSR